MKFKYLLAMSAAALVMTNCSKEESLAPELENGATEIIANVEGKDARSTTNDAGAFKWADGDKLMVMTGTEKSVYLYDATKGTFGLNSGNGITSTSSYAIYPYEKISVYETAFTVKSDEAVEKVTFPAEYGSTDTEYEPNTHAMMLAKVDPQNPAVLNFTHLGGVMRFTIKDVPAGISSFTFTASDPQRINGSFVWSGFTKSTQFPEGDLKTTNEGVYYIETVSGESYGAANSFTYKFKSSDAARTMTFYVPLPVGTYNNFTIKLGDNITKTYSAANEIKRRTLLMMPALKVNGTNLENVDADNESTVTLLEDGQQLTVNGSDETVTINVDDNVDATAVLNMNINPDDANAEFTISDGSDDNAASTASKATVNVNTTGNVKTLNINAPTLTVKLTSGTYDKVEAKTAQQTLIIGEGVEIGELVLNGGNVKLEGDLELSTPLVIGIETTIDLNGHVIKPAGTSMTQTLNTKDALILVRKGGNLTITDSSKEGNGRIDTGDNSSIYGAIKMTDSADEATGDATLTIEAGSIKGYYYGIMGNGNGGNRNGTVITMTGGKIEEGYCSDDNTGIFHPQLGTLTISGGEITGYKSAVEMRSGTLNISNGTLVSTGTPAAAEANGNGNTITGAAIAVSQHTTNQELKAEISGGTFTGVYALYEEDKQDENVSNISMSVTGGTFNGKIFSENCKNFIKGGTFSNPSACNYLGEGANVTVELAENYEGAGFATASGQTVVLDLNNKTYTATDPLVGSTGTKSQAFQFLKGSNVTIKNGTLTSSQARMFVQNYTDLTLENVTLSPSIPAQTTSSYYYVLSNNSGNVKLEGNTSIIAPTKNGISSFAFDVCKYATYEAPVVTVNTTGTIEGLVEVSGGTLNVTNGTFKNEKGHCVKVVTGTANFNGGNFTAQEVVVFNMAGTVNIAGGTFTSNDNAVISGNGSDDAKYKNGIIEITGGIFNAKIQSSGYVACGIYHPQAGTLKVSGGTFNIENGCGILMRGGSLDMTGNASFNFTGNISGDVTGKVGDSRVVVPCGKMVVKDAWSGYYDAQNINISGVADIYTVNAN